MQQSDDERYRLTACLSVKTAADRLDAAAAYGFTYLTDDAYA